MIVIVVAEVFFADVVFAANMALISATKYGPYCVAPPVATVTPGVVRVGKHRANVSLAHRRTGMLGAAKSAIPNK